MSVLKELGYHPLKHGSVMNWAFKCRNHCINLKYERLEIDFTWSCYCPRCAFPHLTISRLPKGWSLPDKVIPTQIDLRYDHSEIILIERPLWDEIITKCIYPSKEDIYKFRCTDIPVKKLGRCCCPAIRGKPKIQYRLFGRESEPISRDGRNFYAKILEEAKGLDNSSRLKISYVLTLEECPTGYKNDWHDPIENITRVGFHSIRLPINLALDQFIAEREFAETVFIPLNSLDEIRHVFYPLQPGQYIRPIYDISYLNMSANDVIRVYGQKYMVRLTII